MADTAKALQQAKQQSSGSHPIEAGYAGAEVKRDTLVQTATVSEAANRGQKDG